MSGESDCIWVPDFCKMNEDVYYCPTSRESVVD